jgi:prevent-host-death family protein
MEVGVRELRQRLAELLDRAAAGEIVRVTHRGRAKAVIAPPRAEQLLKDARAEVVVEERIAQGVREGWIRPGRGGRPVIPKRGFKGKMSSEEALREDRDDE